MKFINLFDSKIDSYLRQCRVINPLVEAGKTHVPPTPDETKFLISYLRKLGLKPAIAGSVGILRHVGGDTRDFRPTVDLDVWVSKVPAPPEGWRRDRESIGVDSWISPSGGYVDFLVGGHQFTDGYVTPSRIDYDPDSESTDYPVADWKTILKMKLSTMRSKDLSDCMALVRKMGVPSDKELGRLSQTQKENLGLIRQWVALRPTGKYGE